MSDVLITSINCFAWPSVIGLSLVVPLSFIYFSEICSTSAVAAICAASRIWTRNSRSGAYVSAGGVRSPRRARWRSCDRSPRLQILDHRRIELGCLHRDVERNAEGGAGGGGAAGGAGAGH